MQQGTVCTDVEVAAGIGERLWLGCSGTVKEMVDALAESLEKIKVLEGAGVAAKMKRMT